MGFGTQMVYFRAHRQRDSRFIQYADVYCQTVVMQSAATCRVGDVDIFGSAFHHVPHLLLYAHGAGGVVNNQAVAGMPLL